MPFTLLQDKSRPSEPPGNRIGQGGAAREPGHDHVCAASHDLEYLQLLANVFFSTGQGAFVTDQTGTILEVNRAFTEILGYTREEVLGKNPRLWQSGNHDAAFYRSLWETLFREGHWRGEIWNRRKNGEVFPQLQTISAIFGSDGEPSHFTSVFSDISEIKQVQEQLHAQAHRDPLTDLPNRLLFEERLDHALRGAHRSGTRLAVIFVDLDNFKHINDSLSHAAGDALLQGMTERLNGITRESDTVARFGGDEFAVLLENIAGADDAARTAQKLISTLSVPLRVEGREIRSTASIGISLYPEDGTDPSTLLRNADSAMYRAKDEGRNGFSFYTPDLTHAAFERMLLEHNLRQALERDEFSLVYHPQVELGSRRITGAEALIRWQHPEMGTVSPGRFIPVAEQSDLIHGIGNWVLRAACEQAREWLDLGIHFGRIAVNVGGPQVQRGKLVEEVEMVLAETNLPASCLELEVTETFVMQRIGEVRDQLEQLRRIGITLAVDDFGTGYSSLRYLKELPIHKLKIDQSFVSDTPDDADDAAIVETIVAMGRGLRLETIAEGVETEPQAAFLQQLGCRRAQGFLFSYPLPSADFRAQIDPNVPRAAASPDSEST